MSGGAYYNEIDSYAADWLENLIAAGHIAPGVVDRRDIRDVVPSDLFGFTQCHFFAGIGVWSYALRRAGWPDDRPVWTGSCPCQPFSAAGKGQGFADERHLWPAWNWLIDQCRPVDIAGEQVADKGADAWVDLVQADLEGMDYTFGCVPLTSAGFGAPNPRHRTFWLAHAASIGHEWPRAARRWGNGSADVSNADRLANATGSGCARICGRGQDRIAEYSDAHRMGDTMRNGAGPISRDGDRPQGEVDPVDGSVSRSGATFGDTGTTGGLADAGCVRWSEGRECGAATGSDGAGQCCNAFGLADTLCSGRPERGTLTGGGSLARGGVASLGDPGPVNGFWRDADWLYCRDPRGPRWRPVDSGTFPLAPSTPTRVGALRGSGNAINAEVAKGFIEAYLEHEADAHLAATRSLTPTPAVEDMLG